MRNLISNLLAKLKAKVDRFGYPIVKLTAPKSGIYVKVNLQDPAFQRPISELKQKSNIIQV